MPSTEIPPLEFLQLIGERHRWQLLRALTDSDRRVGELTEILEEPQNLVSYHLAELRKAGLVSARRSSADGRDTYYRVVPGRTRELLASVGAALEPGLRLASVRRDLLPTGRTRPPKVLFLCTGNSARSQMAEALLTHRTDGAFQGRSAGSHPKPLHPNAVRAMAERGIDISGHTTKHLRRFGRTRFDRVVTLCDKVREVCPEFPGWPRASHWSVADPAAETGSNDRTYDAFARTANDLDTRIGLLIGQMTEERQTEREVS